MALKKTHILIAIFILFWIIVIGWGMFKTSVKLFQEKITASIIKSKPAEQQKVITEEIKSREETPAPASLQQEPPAEPGEILVRTFKVKAAEFQDVLPVMGTAKGKTEVELKFEINGVVKNINFREGEKIKKGELIASLDPKDAQLKANYARNKFNSAEAAYLSAQKKLEVHEKLYEAGAIIKSKLEEVELESESARFQVETARSEMELAENELTKASLHASKDGVMGPRETEEGEFVTPQDKIGTLLETEEVYIEVGVVERDINKIKIGQNAKVYVDAYPNITFEGKVERIFPVVEGKSRTLTAKIKVPNPEGSLFPGMFARAEILIAQLKEALMVPATSLVRTGAGLILIPVIPSESLEKAEDGSQTGTVNLRRVNLGYATSDYAQITEGIEADDLVVIETQGELKDKARVKILDIEEMTF